MKSPQLGTVFVHITVPFASSQFSYYSKTGTGQGWKKIRGVVGGREGAPNTEDLCTHTTIVSRSLKVVCSIAQSSSLLGEPLSIAIPETG